MNWYDSQDHSTVADYDGFASAFARSRAGMHWPEFDILTTELRNIQWDRPRLLDIWCGSGRLLEALWAQNIPVIYHGIDESKLMIQEAQKAHPENKFSVIPMQNLDTIDNNFDIIVFLASFHHLRSQSERLEVLKKAWALLATEGKLFMTNWHLTSEANQKKYQPTTPGWYDFAIKFAKSLRFYHAFQTEELSELFETAWFIDIRHMVNERNIVSIATRG